MTRSGAAGDDTEAGGRRTPARYPHDSGSGHSDRRQAVLEPIFEADFEDNAYGYRPRRSAGDAVKETHRLICRGYTDVVDADLSKVFRFPFSTWTSSDRWPDASSTGMCCG